eukprot:gene4056-5799_t
MNGKYSTFDQQSNESVDLEEYYIINNKYPSHIKQTRTSINKYITFVIAGVILLGSGLLILVYSNSAKTFTSNMNSVTSQISTAVEISNPISTNQPNFIFILADDLSWNSVGYQDFDFKKLTPSLIALADSGVRMMTYYTQEMCTPGRTALLTGRYPISVGNQYQEYSSTSKTGLNLNEMLLAEVLKEKGNYTTYMLGKWNLGHHTPDYLPTARGFDYYMGYLSPASYYWSHLMESGDYYDLTVSDTTCYRLNPDNTTYSTHLYGNSSINIIRNHDFDLNPMFLYLAPNSVHDPYYDTAYPNGVPSSYIPDELYESILIQVDGEKRQEMAKVLVVLDGAINEITQALKSVGQYDNTYIIFSSDNGGCKYEGGKNGPMRGNKGTLFEGGTKVDALISSPLLHQYYGREYYGLMHAVDWFPTILELAGIEYEAADGYELDGVSQVSGIKGLVTDFPRKHMLYNIYLNVSGEDFDIYENANVAVRNVQYKLMHHYTGNAMDGYDDYDVTLTDDYFGNDTEDGSCSNGIAMTGNYTYMLFDLLKDPYETTNLYNLTEYKNVQEELEEYISIMKTKATKESYNIASSSTAYKYWKKHGKYVQPWSFESVTGKSSPKSGCEPDTSVFE